MKMNLKMICALASVLLLAASVTAQTNISAPVQPAPAPVSAPVVAPAKPAAKPAAKPVATKKKAVVAKPVAKKFVEKSVVLLPGAATVEARNVNVRGRSTILSEPLARVTKGDAVYVIEAVENKWAKGDDMKQWARIAYPTNARVWVFSSFINADKTVKPAKLNLRGGPGENYSIVGRMTKGETVTEITTKGEWMQIQPTAGCSAFIAATFLKQDSAMILAGGQPTMPVVPIEPASTNIITEATTSVPPTVDSTTELAAFVNQAAGYTNLPPDKTDEPLQPRVVMREGYVRNATSIQAPSYYSLVGMDTGRTINYLYTSSTNVNLNRYANMHVIVTGEESLDARWPNTPVLTLQRIQVVKE